ncbi:MAG: primosomal protein N', partial [Tannerella sp.]|jgi:primosomal protein N' (replication factor Y)|nr:primosomal protein N' [Tannerella sp.]
MEASVRQNFRVIVPFGKRRYYTAIVRDIREQAPETPFTLKDIFVPLDGTPVLSPLQLPFWEWVASYYLCTLGDVYTAAVPSGLKLESETVVSRCEGAVAQHPLPAGEQALLDAFDREAGLTVSALEKKTGRRHLIPALNSLVNRGFVTVSETIGRGFVPKTETCVRLAPAYAREEDWTPVFEQLQRAGQQKKLLLAFLERAQSFPLPAFAEISRKELLHMAGVKAPALDALLKRGILTAREKEVSRLQMPAGAVQPLHALTAAQQTAREEIRQAFAGKPVCLLHGVPSSGKTEIYMHLIMETLQQGRQALYLLPEIALTTQVMERLSRTFGDRLLLYHSGLSGHGRVEVWNRLLQAGQPLLVLGVRSSLFLPFSGLGLVIVDEEQEPSYRQSDPAPRYHARNAALMLASMHGAKTLLGSATPSLESCLNARTGKYGLVSLKTRYGTGLPPQIHLTDVKDLKRRKIMKDTLFSPLLKEKMDEALSCGEQVVLFQNRRGFAPMMECKSCHRTLHCVRCDVSLTWHKQANRLVCHYCGYSTPPPSRCPSCNGNEMQLFGFGTEKVEEEMAALFPGAKAARLDLDTAHTRRACERILADFEQGKTHVLIGTQMVAKGLDFDRVSVVGVLNADSLMNVPDFRAHERAFQLMMQVGGRAGRREKQGTVVIQTSQPEHPLLQMVCTSDYGAMAQNLLGERQLFRYPPYVRLITVILRSREEQVLMRYSAMYAGAMRGVLGARVYGPFAPPVGRVQTLYVRHVMLKLERSLTVAFVRETLNTVCRNMQSSPDHKHVRIHYDVDN